MKIIKCDGFNCNEQYEEEDEKIIGWYCKTCMEKIMGNAKAWLESDECKEVQNELTQAFKEAE